MKNKTSAVWLDSLRESRKCLRQLRVMCEDTARSGKHVRELQAYKNALGAEMSISSLIEEASKVGNPRRPDEAAVFEPPVRSSELVRCVDYLEAHGGRLKRSLCLTEWPDGTVTDFAWQYAADYTVVIGAKTAMDAIRRHMKSERRKT